MYNVHVRSCQKGTGLKLTSTPFIPAGHRELCCNGEDHGQDAAEVWDGSGRNGAAQRRAVHQRPPDRTHGEAQHAQGALLTLSARRHSRARVHRHTLTCTRTHTYSCTHILAHVHARTHAKLRTYTHTQHARTHTLTSSCRYHHKKFADIQYMAISMSKNNIQNNIIHISI